MNFIIIRHFLPINYRFLKGSIDYGKTTKIIDFYCYLFFSNSISKLAMMNGPMAFPSFWVINVSFPQR